MDRQETENKMNEGFIKKMSLREFRVYYREAERNLFENGEHPNIFESWYAANRILDRTHKESLKRIKIREILYQHDVYGRLQEFNFAAKFYFFVRGIVAEHFERDGLIEKVS